MTALETHQLGRRYGRRWALHDCTLTIPQGHVVALVGSNGAGKTTLLHLAVGLLEPSMGTVSVLDGPPLRERADQLRRVGFVGQDKPLYDTFRVQEMLRFGGWANPSWDRSIAEEHLRRVDVPFDQRVGKLSGGQRAQVALAVALGKRPELLLLDEPVANLDPLARREFLGALMEQVAETGLTVVLSSHLVADLERVCDYLVLLSDGGVQLAGETEHLLNTHAKLVGPCERARAFSAAHTVLHESHTCGAAARTRDRPSLDRVLIDARRPRLGLHAASRHQYERTSSTRGAVQRGVRMMRLALRQHRLHVGSGFAAIAVLAVVLIWTGHEMTTYMHTTGLSACLATNGHCDGISQLFRNRYGGLLQNIAYLNFLPMLAGVFWGAPLVAREIEQGTYRLAWTQSITRRRWLTTNLTVYTAAAIVLATMFSVLLAWWFRPFAHVGFGGGYGRLQPNVFDFQGIVPIAYTLYAFAIGITAGVLIRHTLPAMVVTLAAFLPLRLELQSLRAHFLTPLHLTYQAAGISPRAGQHDWILRSYLVDHLGRQLPDQPIASTCQPLAVAKTSDMTPCLIAHGFHQLDIYQPASRFWALQSIESAIFLGLTITLLAITTWWITHRTN